MIEFIYIIFANNLTGSVNNSNVQYMTLKVLFELLMNRWCWHKFYFLFLVRGADVGVVRSGALRTGAPQTYLAKLRTSVYILK